MEFSGIVKITDLNDFLSPSSSCSVHTSMIKTTPEKTATVHLSDCLACSGCVTSAETVLLEQHSLEVFRQKLGNERITISLSQQTIFAISQKFSFTPQETLCKLSGKLKSLGVEKVIDMSLSRDLSLHAAANEFIERFQAQNTPVLCSECPGWVLFAEKKADESILPHLSHVKTPMMIQTEIYNLKGLYNIAVMPCYDKKLEAVMEKGVDLVITTTELLSFLEENDFQNSTADPEAPVFYSSTKHKSGSLGYGEFIFLKAVQVIYGETPEMEIKSTRRRDLLELEYRDLKFCFASGFQNIQNIVRLVKQKRNQYSYIEIMACPSGCLNGGGQPRLSREIITSLENSIAEYYVDNIPEVSVDTNLYREFKPLPVNNLHW